MAKKLNEKELDKELRKLDEAMKNPDTQLEKTDWKKQMKKWSITRLTLKNKKEVAESLKEIDFIK